MTIFNFYALENKASEERKDLFGEVSDAVNADKMPVSATPEDCLGSFFETNHSLELPVLITSGNGSGATTCWDKHKCDVLRHEGGVILMTVEANKSKHTTIDKKDVEHQHHPYSIVLIDNRPGHQMVGIERNSAFRPQPRQTRPHPAGKHQPPVDALRKKSGAEEPQEEEYGVLACDKQAAQQLW